MWLSYAVFISASMDAVRGATACLADMNGKTPHAVPTMTNRTIALSASNPAGFFRLQMNP
ncbi:MAG: hypothetical protein ABSE90_08830 [Verrucomicrobiota bacterium]